MDSHVPLRALERVEVLETTVPQTEWKKEKTLISPRLTGLVGSLLGNGINTCSLGFWSELACLSNEVSGLHSTERKENTFSVCFLY